MSFGHICKVIFGELKGKWFKDQEPLKEKNIKG